jgi:acetoin:2,6-dichlorophenolindophenol oxidoreductase subunit beta
MGGAVRNIRYIQAVNEVLHEAMESDDSYLYLGEDVRKAVRGVARGLHDRFGDERVLDCPISESAFTGAATGAAMAGLRPIVEYQITALLYIAFDQLIDQAQKLTFITGGQTSVPVTYLMAGSGWRPGIAGQHSDNPYALLVHGGMKTVIPMTAADAAGLLRTSLLDPDPVMVFLPAAALPQRGDVPDAPFAIPLGSGRIAREGSDVTVVAIGALVPAALAAAEELEHESVHVEVIDPRSLLPFDYDLVESSVGKTGRLVVCDDASQSCSVASEIAATIGERCHSDLAAPIERVARPDIPVPFASSLESAVVPGAAAIVASVRRVTGGERLVTRG